MKAVHFLSLILLGLSAFSPELQAQIKVPRHVHPAADLEKAKQSAVAEGKPLAFVYSRTSSTCSLCRSATERMFDEMRNVAVIVLVEEKKEMPREVIKALARKGKFIPKLVVFSPDMSQELGFITYEEVKEDGKKAFRELKSTLRKFEPATPEPAPATPAG